MDDIISRGIERVYEAFPDAYDSRDPAFLDALNDVVLEALQSPDLTREVVTMPRPRKNKGYTPPESQPYVGIRTAMEILGLTRQGVMRQIEYNRIPSAYQVDEPRGTWIMLKSDVIQLKNERESN